MKCPYCNNENSRINGYCDQCGSALFQSTLSYAVPPIKSLPQHDQIANTQSDYSFLVMDKLIPTKIELSQKGLGATIFKATRSILYFLATFIAAFGFFGAFISINDNSLMQGLGLFFALASIVVSIVIFLCLRHRVQQLKWPQFLGGIAGVTIGTFMALILASTFFPNATKGPGSFFFGCIFMLFGFLLAVVASW